MVLEIVRVVVLEVVGAIVVLEVVRVVVLEVVGAIVVLEVVRVVVLEVVGTGVEELIIVVEVGDTVVIRALVDVNDELANVEVVVSELLIETKAKLWEFFKLVIILLILIFGKSFLFASYNKKLSTMMLPFDRLLTTIELGGLLFRAEFI